MSNQHNIRDEVNQTLKELAREDDVHVVGVHIMSEFMFCPRAGIIALENRGDDMGLDFVPAPALGGLPMHESDQIEIALEAAHKELREATMFPLGAIVAGGLAYLVEGLVLGMALGSSSIIFWPAMRKRLRNYYTLKKRLKLVESARQGEPDWNMAVEQEVNWWELQKAGFESVEKVEPLKDSEIGLAGKPWRVLQKGAFHVPVIRLGGESERLHRQHLARLAAYSYLIYKCERAQANWGVILFGKSDRGVAVPIRPESWIAFREGLRLTRDIITQYQQNPMRRVAAPDDNSRCKNCPHGRPRKILAKTKIGNNTIEPYLTADVHGTKCHSVCGDRFRWVPPHDDARMRGLMD